MAVSFAFPGGDTLPAIFLTRRQKFEARRLGPSESSELSPSIVQR